MITRIYHKKNELFEVEFYQDKECTQAFDFMDKKDLYIELVNGDISPLVRLRNQAATWQNICTPYLCEQFKYYEPLDKIKTLDDITPNLSKYIPTSNAVLFLSEEEANKHSDNCESWFLYQKDFPTRLSNSEMDIRDWKAITIFLPHGTESELKKANEIAHELKEKYGVDEVNLFVLHLFKEITQFYEKIVFYSDSCLSNNIEDWHNLGNINKIIATNSTGISEPQDEKRLQILDCYDIFNDYLKGE